MSIAEGESLNEMADKIEVLIRRYKLLLSEIPARFTWWANTTPAQKRAFATFESVCIEMFPDQLSHDRRWVINVACCALKNWISEHNYSGAVVSKCGKALRMIGEGKRAPSIGDAELDAIKQATLTDVINMQMECRLKGLLKSHDDSHKRKRDIGESTDRVFAFLAEAKTEALDALSALSNHTRPRSNHTLKAANAEIRRLESELDSLRKGSREVDRPAEFLIHPKRALSMAGYWNLEPNDLLRVSQMLTERVKIGGGRVVLKKDGMYACFSVADRKLIEEAAVSIMSEILPSHPRRMEPW